MPDPVPTSPATEHAAAAATLLAVGEVASAAASAVTPAATEAERHLAARVAELEADLARDRQGLVELMRDRDAARRELAVAEADLANCQKALDDVNARLRLAERPTVVTAVPLPPPVSDEEHRQRRAAMLLASLEGAPDVGAHTEAEARCARALWAAETSGTDVPPWEELEVPQRRAVVSHAREFLRSDTDPARLARALLGV